MKTKILLALAFAGWTSLSPLRAADAAAASPPSPTPPPMTVAVLPFDTSDDRLKGKGDEIAALLDAQLSTKPELWLVERTDIAKILGEQTLGLSGLADPGTAARVGNLLGARALITGRLINAGGSYLLVAKIMSTDTSRVFGATVESGSADNLSAPAADLAGQIAKILGEQAAVFNAPVETLDIRMARLHKLVDGKKLPSVQIKVTEHELAPERDVTIVVRIDPAVATEFKKMLGDLGFEIIDTASSKVPDVVITGEAITQEGARRDQLVSERARIEITAKQPKDDKVLDVDRETSVAVDTAPAIAGKTALQNTAEVLVERLVPKLIQP